MSEEALKEAAVMAQQTVGFSTYLHGINYDVDQFVRELDQVKEFIKAHPRARKAA